MNVLASTCQNALFPFLHAITQSDEGHAAFAAVLQRALGEHLGYGNSLFFLCEPTELYAEEGEGEKTSYSIQYLDRCLVAMEDGGSQALLQQRREKLCQSNYHIIDGLVGAPPNACWLGNDEISGPWPAPWSGRFLLARFYDRQGLVGALHIFPREGEEDFPDGDRAAFEHALPFIDSCYRQQVERSRERGRAHLLAYCHRQAPMGIIVLDDGMNVCRVNDIATSYCRDIVEHGLPKLSARNNVYHALGVASQVGQIISDIQENLSERMAPVQRQYKTVAASYEIQVLPSRLPGGDLDRETYYFMYISRQEDKKRSSLNEVAQHYGLTSREMDIVYLLEEGYNNMDIGKKLFISCNTVKAHLSNIFRKLKVNSRTALLYTIRNVRLKA